MSYDGPERRTSARVHFAAGPCDCERQQRNDDDARYALAEVQRAAVSAARLHSGGDIAAAVAALAGARVAALAGIRALGWCVHSIDGDAAPVHERDRTP